MFKKYIFLSQSFGRKLTRDAMTAYASDTTLYIVISFFPFLMFLLTLLQYLPFTQGELMAVVTGLVPVHVAQVIEYFVKEIYSTSSIVLSITVIATLWTASRGTLGIYRGLNSIYGIDETRNYFVLRFLSMLYTLIFCVMLFMLLGLYVFGNQIISWIDSWFPAVLLNRFAMLIVSFRSAIGILILFVFFIVMYNFIPNRKTKFFSQLPGAIFAAVGWVVFSYLYSIYIDHIGKMTATYGSLTALVLAVLWLYFCMYLFFLGAEINSVLIMPECKAWVKKIFTSKK